MGTGESKLQFSMTDEQVMLQALLERFVTERYGSGQRATYRAAAHGYSLENWAQLADLGVLGAAFEVEYGGLGGGSDATMVLMETLGRGLVAEPVLEQVVLPGRLIGQAHARAQAQRWLPRLIGGETHVALAHFEQSTGGHLDTVETVARSAPPGNVLDGEKTFVPAGAGADIYLVSARAGDGNSSELGFYLVRANAPGLTARPYRLVDGSMACTLSLRATPALEMLDCGAEAFLRAMDDARIAAGAEMLGIMSTLFDATLEHVRNRKQFGAPLGAFQVIQHRLADLYVRLEQSRSQLYRAALSEPADRPAAVAAMKSYISAAAIEMGEQCIHLHGGMGMADEVAIGHGHKRILVLATLLGDADDELQRFAKLAS
jgi:alkylation response protein AidB-like acyl-CoA dehydrogenase